MQDANAFDAENSLLGVIKDVSVCRVDYIKYLRPTNEAKACDEFLENDDLERPHYRYVKVDVEHLEQKQEHIAELLQQIQLREDLPRELIDEMIKELGQDWYHAELVLAAHEYRTGKNTEDAEQRFLRASDAVFGRMHADTFWALLRERVAAINTVKMSQKNMALYRELLDRIGVMGRNRKKRYVPSKETITVFRERLRQFFVVILRHVPEDKDSFTPSEAAAIINTIIEQEVGIWDDKRGEGTRFRAEVEVDKLTAVMDVSKKRILLPGARGRNYTRSELEKIIVHEFGVHVLRALSQEHQDLRAFFYAEAGGLYSRLTEEGLAKVCEQALDGRYDDLCIVRYLAIGLAQVCKKTFRETYEIIWRLEKLYGSGREKSDCFAIVQRAYRGTGVLPINTDLIYYRGMAAVWKFIEDNLDDVGLMSLLFLSGKNDFLRQERKTLLKTMREDGLIEK